MFSRLNKPPAPVPAPRPAPRVIDAPAVDLVERVELQARLCDLLLAGDAGLHGPGGFGKTTLAEQVARLPRVRAQVPGGLLRVSVGQRTTGPALADLLGDLIEQLTGERPATVSPAQAGRRLGTALDQRPPVLLVIDDVWTREQLEPFLIGGATARRLIVTRVRDLLPADLPRLAADEMTPGEATALLTGGLGALSGPDRAALLARTGRWPLLTAVVNGVLRQRPAASDLLDRLGAEPAVALDLAVPGERDRAVDRVVRAALHLLPEADRHRYLELGVFPAGGSVPDRIVDLLWSGTGGLSSGEAALLRTTLARLRLVEPGDGGVRLHDVLRTYLRERLPEPELARVNRRLVELARPRSGGPWPALPRADRYLWRHLGFHLREARWWDELFAVVTDLDRLAVAIPLVGVAAVVADLDRLPDQRASALRARLSRSAGLLRPIRPAAAFADVLIARLAGAPEVAAEVAAFAAGQRGRAGLTARWPLPDAGPESLTRVITGGDGWLDCAVTSARGWIASGGETGAVSLHDAATGALLGRLLGHTAGVKALVVTRNGEGLVSAGADRTLRRWDVARRCPERILWTAPGEILGCAASPGGERVAAVDSRGELAVFERGERIFARREPEKLVACAFLGEDLVFTVTSGGAVVRHDLRTGTAAPVPAGSPRESVTAFTADPGGAWLAVGRADGGIEVHPRDGGTTAVALVGHRGCVSTLAAFGDQIISGGEDGTVRVWDRYGGEVAVVRAHPGWVTSCVVAADRRTLITTGSDASIRVWDVPRLAQETVAGPITWVTSCAVAPSGGEVMTGERDGAVRVWRTADAVAAPIWRGSEPVTRCGFGPGGAWVTAVCGDRLVLLRREPDGEWVAGELPGTSGGVAAPDQDLLAAWGPDGVLSVRPVSSVLAPGPAPESAAGSLLPGAFVAGAEVFRQAIGRPVRAAAFLPGHRLIVADDTGALTVWRYRAGRIRSVPGRAGAGPGEVRAIQVAGDRVVVVDPFGVALYTVRGLRLAGAAEFGDGPVTDAAVSSDGQWLATTDADGELRIWPLTDIDAGFEPVAAMRVDGALVGCAWAPGSLDLYAAGRRGTYAFTFRTPRVAPQPATGPRPAGRPWAPRLRPVR
ncbi:hypothetical protein Apa02nite_052970 [Actinoplanes palleronii]|uniref:NB-ARC domain-containing protein n=1 Tax=Actinoplanes palleronii TaxID=113570 RepID=A0ABQ4BET9_9ACTN|nr:hypothetical protein Apa02nite_052970 [Actinoplanes palleronii]